MMILAALAGAAVIAGELRVEPRTDTPPNAATLAASEREQFRAECERGDAVACNNLGVVTSDRTRAFPLFERACKAGSPDACNNLGALYENGEGAPTDLDEARLNYSRACDAGVALGCSNLGVLYVAGKGVPRDRERAEELFFRACESGHPLGCANLGALAQ